MADPNEIAELEGTPDELKPLRPTRKLSAAERMYWTLLKQTLYLSKTPAWGGAEGPFVKNYFEAKQILFEFDPETTRKAFAVCGVKL